MGYMKEQYNNYMIESNIEWYTEQAEKLVNYINCKNSDAQKLMENNPNVWIGKLTNDPDHWAEYGVHTPADLVDYLDRELEREWRKEEQYI